MKNNLFNDSIAEQGKLHHDFYCRTSSYVLISLDGLFTAHKKKNIKSATELLLTARISSQIIVNVHTD